MSRTFVNLLTEDVEKSAQFYETLLGLTRHADFGWVVIPAHRDTSMNTPRKG